jgi:hypothetical protein
VKFNFTSFYRFLSGNAKQLLIAFDRISSCLKKRMQKGKTGPVSGIGSSERREDIRKGCRR